MIQTKLISEKKTPFQIQSSPSLEKEERTYWQGERAVKSIYKIIEWFGVDLLGKHSMQLISFVQHNPRCIANT